MQQYGLHDDFSSIKWIRIEIAEILIKDKLKTIPKILMLDFEEKQLLIERNSED